MAWIKLHISRSFNYFVTFISNTANIVTLIR